MNDVEFYAFSASVEMIVWFLSFLVGTSTSGGVFWGVCGLIMIFGSPSVNGWGCVPILLVVWHRVSSTVA